MKVDYNKILGIDYECNSTDISSWKFEDYMAEHKVGNKSMIKKQIKIFLPLWYDRIEKDNSSYKFLLTKKHLIIPIEQTQHFFRYRL